MLRKLAFTTIAALILIGMIGCSESTTSPADSTDVSEQFGGYTASNEDVAFGDNDLLAEKEGEDEYNDLMLTDPAVDSIVEDPESGYYHMRVVWGKLVCDSFPTEPIPATDWSGALQISRGAEILRRVIRFEYGQDYIVPRNDRSLIEWVSKTTVHNDGIAVDLRIPRPQATFDTSYVVDNLGDTTAIVVDTIYPEVEPVTVSFRTGPYSNTFTLPDLAALDTLIEIDPNNAVSFHAFEVKRNVCGKGFMAGHWGYDENNQGVFQGLWMNRYGWVTGYFKGEFGKDSATGNNVFVGKWIHDDGTFGGLIKGTYGKRPSPNASEVAHNRAVGWYWGMIYDANGGAIGEMKGRYRAHPQYRYGFLQGRWKLRCNEEITANANDYWDGF